MTETIATLSRLAQRHPLHPAVMVAGIMIVAVTAKLGHGLWGISGLLAFYPAYLVLLLLCESAAAMLSRSLMSSVSARPAYARVRGRP